MSVWLMPVSPLRINNFDFLRFSFAFVVFLVHAYVLSGAKSLAPLADWLSSEIAVKSFFVVSGFLIFMSYEKSRSLQGYFSKRIRRIYPAYAAVILIWALLGSIFSSAVWSDYFTLDLLKYMAANLVFLNFLHPNLPGLFENNSLQAVNGALWTLKIEVMFYLAVPVFVWAFQKLGRLPVLVTGYLASVVYTYVMFGLAESTGSGLYLELQRQLPGQLAFFLAGAMGYYYLDLLMRYRFWLVAIAVLGFALQSWLPWLALQPLMLGMLVIFTACLIPCLGNFGEYGDFSYGVYIVHFPILQTMVAYGFFTQTPWLDVFMAGMLVLVSAYIFWYYIEKPFLRKTSHYVAINRS